MAKSYHTTPCAVATTLLSTRNRAVRPTVPTCHASCDFISFELFRLCAVRSASCVIQLAFSEVAYSGIPKPSTCELSWEMGAVVDNSNQQTNKKNATPRPTNLYSTARSFDFVAICVRIVVDGGETIPAWKCVQGPPHHHLWICGVEWSIFKSRFEVSDTPKRLR